MLKKKLSLLFFKCPLSQDNIEDSYIKKEGQNLNRGYLIIGEKERMRLKVIERIRDKK
jgi:hypothetical protein